METEQIVNEAIPKVSCPVTEAGNVHRREQLKKRIEDKIAEAQRDKREPYKPELEYKDSK